MLEFKSPTYPTMIMTSQNISYVSTDFLVGNLASSTPINQQRFCSRLKERVELSRGIIVQEWQETWNSEHCKFSCKQCCWHCNYDYLDRTCYFLSVLCGQTCGIICPPCISICDNSYVKCSTCIGCCQTISQCIGGCVSDTFNSIGTCCSNTCGKIGSCCSNLTYYCDCGDSEDWCGDPSYLQWIILCCASLFNIQ